MSTQAPGQSEDQEPGKWRFNWVGLISLLFCVGVWAGIIFLAKRYL